MRTKQSMLKMSFRDTTGVASFTWYDNFSFQRKAHTHSCLTFCHWLPPFLIRLDLLLKELAWLCQGHVTASDALQQLNSPTLYL